MHELKRGKSRSANGKLPCRRKKALCTLAGKFPKIRLCKFKSFKDHRFIKSPKLIRRTSQQRQWSHSACTLMGPAMQQLLR